MRRLIRAAICLICVSVAPSIVAAQAPALAPPPGAGNTELLYITEGSGIITTGGTLVPAAGGKPASIANGVEQRFTKGDVIIVPVGSPHWFSTIDTLVTYLEVRWAAPK